MTPENERKKRITVFYLPQVGAENAVYETTGKAGYRVHSDDNGALGYLLYVDNQTILVPSEHVLRIETEF